MLRILGGLVEIDAVGRADDGTPADARQERREPVGVGGITKKELHAPLL